MTAKRAIAPFLASLLLPGFLSGCIYDRAVDPVLEERLFNALGGLRPGEALTLSGEDAREIVLTGRQSGAEYLYVPFLADTGGARLTVTVQGTGIERSTEGPTPARAAAPARGDLPELPRPGAEWERGEDERWHSQRLALAARQLPPALATARSARAARLAAPRLVAPPTLGASVTVRVPDFNTGSACGNFSERSGRVVAIGSGAVVVSDVDNPPNGFSTFDFQSFAERFDDLIAPSDTAAFGAPSDLDANRRVVIFFTRAVNEETPPGASFYVGGYFWVGDLLPRAQCAQSNEGEIFYMLVPDRDGVVNGNRFSTAFVRGVTVGTLGHEFEHLINAGRRIYVNGAPGSEEVWLDEGLAHIAEELLFYRSTTISPRQNVDLERIYSTTATTAAMNAYVFPNMLRFIEFLRAPGASAIAAGDDLGSRGASWAFLRYAADRRNGDDRQFFHALVNSRTSGLRNLAEVLGEDPLEWMHDWNVSVFSDDMGIPTEDRFSQPSWNFRALVPPLLTAKNYPLQVLQPAAGEELRVRLTGTGTAFVRLIAPGGTVARVLVTPAQGSAARYRVTVMRIR